MKLIQIIFVFLCIIYITTVKEEKSLNKDGDDEFISDCYKDQPKKENECRDRIKEEDKSLGFHCCLFKVEGRKDICHSINKTQYEHQSQYIKDYESTYKVNVISLDCKSNYIKLGLLSLIYLLFK